MRILTRETPENIGKEVELAGWVDVRRDHGKIIFIDLRDRGGLVQLVFTPGDKEIYEKASTLRSEWVIRVKGEVSKRPDKMVNENIPTGKVEVAVSSLEILTEADTTPFDIHSEGYDVNEEVRMKYRYVDLRRSRLRENLKKRFQVTKFIRDFLSKEDFTEIETPFISKSTPEGARDYLVPSRVYPGKFYALPQSPQQYKQLLMVAGMERYFQIVRCFRDEDSRGDRQPEFTQLDMEMSFTNPEEILSLVEKLCISIVKELYPEKKIQQTPFPQLSYAEVMEKYNTDRPDLRKDKNNPDELAFAFVVDFPMFEYKEGDKRWGATHHPFTQPKVKDAEEFKKMFKSDPGGMLAMQYDLVLNGSEVAGGSIRIHDPKLLAAVFEALGNDPEAVKAKFGHMLEAFKYGVPPHGGIAFGFDRFIMMLQNEPNIREVIAFPKTGDGRDLLMDGPSEVSEEQLKELRLRITNDKDKK